MGDDGAIFLDRVAAAHLLEDRVIAGLERQMQVLAYTRQVANRQQQIVVDMARDLFQPKNDTQTSMVLMRRLSVDEEKAAAMKGLDYPVFLAVAEKIGHDKRGNLIYRRTSAGEDALVTRTENITEVDPATGDRLVSAVEVKDRLVDDELPEVATSFVEWVAAQP